MNSALCSTNCEFDKIRITIFAKYKEYITNLNMAPNIIDDQRPKTLTFLQPSDWVLTI